MRRKLSVKNNAFREIEIRRLSMNLSLEEFANAIGVDRSTYRSFEKKGDMPMSLLINVCRVLDCTSDSLLGINNVQ